MMENIEGNRDSFIFYRSFFSSLEKCPTEIQLPLFKAIARFGLDHSEPDFSDSAHKLFAEAVWEGIRPQLEANYNRFRNGCKGGCPKGIKKPTMVGNQNASKQNQNKTKTKPNVNENLNDNNNDNDNMSIRRVVKSQLELPFSSDKFRDTWKELCEQPKWRNKTVSALQKSLDKLARYEEPFAVILMEDAIANGWQGLEFNSTPAKYEQWKKSRPQEPAPGDGWRPSRKVNI